MNQQSINSGKKCITHSNKFSKSC